MLGTELGGGVELKKCSSMMAPSRSQGSESQEGLPSSPTSAESVSYSLCGCFLNTINNLLIEGKCSYRLGAPERLWEGSGGP